MIRSKVAKLGTTVSFASVLSALNGFHCDVTDIFEELVDVGVVSAKSGLIETLGILLMSAIGKVGRPFVIRLLVKPS